MNKIKSIAVAALIAISTNVSAQQTNSNGWSSIWFEWNPSSLNHDSKNIDDESFTGLSLGYSRAFNLSSSVPSLFAEIGLGVQYSFKTIDLIEQGGLNQAFYDYMEPEAKFNMLSAKVPVSLMYAINIPNTPVTLIPFAGIDFRYNVLGKLNINYNLSQEAEELLEYTYGKNWQYETGLIDNAYNLFSKNDMGGTRNTWNRFQIGWHIGLKARFGKNFLAGVSYGTDFSEIYNKASVSTTSINIGYAF